MNKPIVSIILPTYNRAWCIERAINSVLDQSNSDWELIIMDGASTDNTEEIIERYQKNSRIKYEKEQKNKGVGSARNIGIEKSKGDYLIFLDSDDELKHCAVAEVIKTHINLDQNVGVVMFATESPNGTKMCYCENDEVVSFKDLIKGDKFRGEYLPTCRKEVFKNKKHRFPELPGGVEAILWYNLAKEYDFLIVNKVLRIYHTEHNDRITGSKGILKRAKYVPKLYDILFDQFETDFIRYNPKKLGYYYLEKSIFEILNGEKKIGRNDIYRSIRYNHKKVLLCISIYVASYLPTFLFILLTISGHRFKKILQ